MHGQAAGLFVIEGSAFLIDHGNFILVSTLVLVNYIYFDNRCPLCGLFSVSFLVLFDKSKVIILMNLNFCVIF